MNKLSIVMYHYVRPIANSKFPNIKGLEIKSFKSQLDYLEENYSIVTSEEVKDAVLKNNRLPSNACWLTFDDGFKDHVKYVMPELLKRKLTGAFFPPRSAIIGSKLLDVHCIQHILCCCEDVDKVVIELNILCKQHGITDNEIDSYYKRYAVAGLYDDADTIYIKRILQHVLPEEIRENITSSLFKKYVGYSMKEFSEKLYMNKDEVSELVKSGMCIGSHGDNHYWLSKISESEQRAEIKNSLEFLEEVGTSLTDWIISYPFGGFNKTTLSLVKEYGASLGLTTEVAVALIGKTNPLTLPRLDTNEFPQ